MTSRKLDICQCHDIRFWTLDAGLSTAIGHNIYLKVLLCSHMFLHIQEKQKAEEAENERKEKTKQSKKPTKG